MEHKTQTAITVKKSGPGLPFAVAGVVVGVLAAWKMLGAMSVFLTGVFDCGQATELLSDVRMGLVIGVLAGGLALALSEAGARRQLSLKWLSMAGSVVGVFVIMVGSMCLIVGAFPEFANCWNPGT